MSNQYRLVDVGNSQLLAGLSELVQQSNGLTAQVIAHLVELELPVCRLMQPVDGDFCRQMQPPDLQEHAATSERGMTRFLQGHAARAEPISAG